MKKSMFIAVAARGGLIQCAVATDSQKDAEALARQWGNSGFDAESDDIKVFENKGYEVVFDFGRWQEEVNKGDAYEYHKKVKRSNRRHSRS